MDLRGKNVVVTGGNSGIGFVTARELAMGGARVTLACRNVGAAGAAAAEIARATGNGSVGVVRLDLASFASARACADELGAKLDHIDVLVNNAGTYTQGDETTADGIHPTMQTNYFGPYLLTRLLMPLIEAAPAARIVNVSSAMYAVGKLDLSRPSFLTARNGFSAYAASKLATILFTQELARRAAASRATANVLHPGLVDTKIMTLRKWYDIFIRAYVDRHSVDVETGARTSIFLASSDAVEGVSGQYFVDCAERDPRLSRRATAMRESLWARTAEIVGLPAD
ncbi:SDR family NAD(P)-dependent oxidoreductase [bacterium]|nr:SDR family NAD(P)-dependent oxidoreductase [bacterium]